MSYTFGICPRGRSGLRGARILQGVAALALVGGVLSPVSGATWTWDGSPSSGAKQWTNANMWNPNTVPANDGTANLVATSTQFWPVVMGTSYNINTLAFGAAGHTLNSGNTLTFSNSGAGVSNTGNNTIAPSIVLAAASTFSSSSGLLTVSGTINNGGNLLVVDGAGNVTLSNSISGAGGLTKNGNGTLNLSGSNSYGGMTTVNSGTVVITNGGLPNALNLTVNGGSVDFSGGAPISVGALTGSGVVTNTGGSQRELKVNNASANSFGGQVNGNLSLTKTGAGRLTLSGNNGFSGNVSISDGTVQVAGSSSMPSGKTVTFVNSSGGLDVTGQNMSVAGVSGSGTVTNSGGTQRTFTLNSNSPQTFTGVFTGNLAVNKSGSGSLTLPGSSSHSGGTNVQQGQLIVNGLITGTTTVSSGADLGGSGFVGRLVGAGSISPGNSPGVITGTSTNASGGLDYNFEFTATGSPNYTNATASINDVLRLTDTSAPGPFEGVALGGGNTVNIYLNVASLPHMSTFRGGFYTDQATDFLSLIVGADFQYYLQDAGGGTTYNGNTYSPLSLAYYPKLLTVADTADFDGVGGNPAINGRVMQLRFDVPEPSSLLLLVSAAGLLAIRRRRTA